MKKTLFVFLLLTLIGCTQNEELDIDRMPVVNEVNQIPMVSYDDALNKALSILAILDGPNLARNGDNKRSVLDCEELLLSDSKNRSKSNENKYYLFNFSNNLGFALVSADERDSSRVYLASEKGNINAQCLTDGSSLSSLMDMINHYQTNSIESRSEKLLSRGDPADDYTYTENIVFRYNYGPLLTTKWSQGSPYNIYIGGVNPMGCGPIALSQIFTYYQAPYSARVGGVNYTYDWSVISQVKNATSIYHQGIAEVSKFIYSVGIACGANYSKNESGVSISGVKNALSIFGYKSNSVKDYSTSDVVNSISNHRLVYMRGGNSSNEGHAWIVDGCSEIKTEYRAYDINGNLVENSVLNDYVYDHYHKYLHLNIGWGESYNRNYTYSYTYSSSIDYRVWVYSNIFSFGGQAFNNDLKTICNIYY